MARSWSDVGPDLFSIEWLGIDKLVPTILERAARRWAQDTALAARISEVPLVGDGIVQTQ